MQQYTPLSASQVMNCGSPSTGPPSQLVPSSLSVPPTSGGPPMNPYLGLPAGSMMPGNFNTSAAHHNSLLTAAALGAIPASMLHSHAAFNPSIHALTLAERLAGKNALFLR